MNPVDIGTYDTGMTVLSVVAVIIAAVAILIVIYVLAGVMRYSK
jgi:hypothetical protein